MKLLHEVLRLERPLIGLDLETTSNKPKEARIVELGLEIMRPDGSVKEWRTLVNPGCPIPKEAMDIHKITDEDVAQAPKFAQLAANLLKGFAHADFCGYNVRFDLAVLVAEFERIKSPWYPTRAHVVDGLRLWQITHPRSLEDFAKANGVELLDAHSALADVKATTRACASWIERHPQLPRSVEALGKLCYPDGTVNVYDHKLKVSTNGEDLMINFGQHAGKSLRALKREDRGYLQWMVGPKSSFNEAVKDAVREVLNA